PNRYVCRRPSNGSPRHQAALANDPRPCAWIGTNGTCRRLSEQLEQVGVDECSSHIWTNQNHFETTRHSGKATMRAQPGRGDKEINASSGRDLPRMMSASFLSLEFSQKDGYLPSRSLIGFARTPGRARIRVRGTCRHV